MPSWVFWALGRGRRHHVGAVLRPVSKSGLVGDKPITGQAVFETVVRYGHLAGLGKITPHDLWRTLAKLVHQGRAPPLDQIQICLGHASIQTTERYLELKQNLHDAPCDRLGLV